MIAAHRVDLPNGEVSDPERACSHPFGILGSDWDIVITSYRGVSAWEVLRLECY